MQYKKKSRWCLFLLVLAACGWATLVGPTRVNAADGANERKSAYERINSTGKLRVGYIVVPPAVIKNPNTGQLSGIFVDTLQQAAKGLGLTIDWVEEVGWGTMIEGLDTNRYDLVCAQIWPNAARARKADFSKPLYYVGIGVYVRKGEKRFKRIDSLDDKAVRIATVDGEMSSSIARQRFPRAQTVSLPQLTAEAQKFLELVGGKADVTFAQTYDAAAFLATHPGAVENIAKDHPIQIFPNSFMIRHGETEFKAMLDTAIEELINQGSVDLLIKKNEQYPGTVFPVARPFRTND